MLRPAGIFSAWPAGLLLVGFDLRPLQSLLLAQVGYGELVSNYVLVAINHRSRIIGVAIVLDALVGGETGQRTLDNGALEGLRAGVLLTVDGDDDLLAGVLAAQIPPGRSGDLGKVGGSQINVTIVVVDEILAHSFQALLEPVSLLDECLVRRVRVPGPGGEAGDAVGVFAQQLAHLDFDAVQGLDFLLGEEVFLAGVDA
jgi:hypothetical protein